VSVWLIEDDAAVGDATRLLLKAEGYRVTAVGSLAEALREVRAVSFDLFVTDYHLGNGETGAGAIAAVRDVVGFRLKAVLMTGDTSSAVQQLRRDSYLPLARKPIKVEELSTLLRALHAA
jgi:DNA-binding NtrC family response regulator